MPKIIDRDQHRKELLIKSFDLFAQKNYGSITMRQLAQSLGVSTGMLYHYFPSKEALFVQLVEEQTQQNILNFLAESGNPATLPERIETLFNFLAKNEDYILKQIVLWVEFCQQQNWADASIQKTLQQAEAQEIKAIANYLQIADEAIVDFIYKFVNGLFLGRLFSCEMVSYKEQGALLSKMLTAYLQQIQPETHEEI